MHARTHASTITPEVSGQTSEFAPLTLWRLGGGTGMTMRRSTTDSAGYAHCTRHPPPAALHSGGSGVLSPRSARDRRNIRNIRNDRWHQARRVVLRARARVRLRANINTWLGRHLLETQPSSNPSPAPSTPRARPGIIIPQPSHV